MSTVPNDRTRWGSAVRALWFVSLALACGRGVSENPLEGLGSSPKDAGGTAAGGGATAGDSGAAGDIDGFGGSGGSNGGTAGVGSARGTGGPGGAPPDGDPTGTPGCTKGSDCASGACLLDVEGESRCCEADCRATGRVCSTAGACVCTAETREVGGECLLVEGQPCQDDQSCASNHCVDRVCCDAACDRECERCDAPGKAGSCVLFGEDPVCVERPGFECTARGRCRLPAGLTCGTDADCDSEQCEPTRLREPVCCEAECSGPCQRCSPSGRCDSFPDFDDGCEEVTCPAPTTCLDYRVPAPHACSGNGQCAQCEPVPARAGIPCGTGKQCDGVGSCRFTGAGSVAAGGRHTCVILDNGNVVCWGLNTSGQLGAAFGRLQVGVTEEPADVDGLEIDFTEDVVELTAGISYTCALFANGRVRCWGRVQDELIWETVNGVLGTPDVVKEENGYVDPRRTGDVKLPGRAVQISAAAGGAHTCALLASGEVVCWGYNANGQCGNGTRLEVAALPNENLRPVGLPERAVAVRAANGHTCALLESGNVACWGSGTSGGLGYGDMTDRLEPQGTVPLGGKATQIMTGIAHVCALMQSKTVRCWGSNRDGELGYGHTLAIGDDETPEQAATLPGPAGRTYLGGDVPVGGNVVQLVNVVDTRATCVRFESGAVRCWGANSYGQLGYGHSQLLGRDYTPMELELRLAGTRVAGGDVALGGPALVLAENGRCALRVDGALFCWGDNENGELGLPAEGPRGSRTRTPLEMGPVRFR